MLSKHPGLCRFPHGHSRRVEVVISSARLDGRDMVCDFKALKLALKGYLDRFDHALAINRQDPLAPALKPVAERVVVFDEDPTTEVLARHVFEFLESELRAGKSYTDGRGDAYAFPEGLVLERVRVTETSSSWAEYGR